MDSVFTRGGKRIRIQNICLEDIGGLTMTRGDEIRSMSDEELAEFLCKVKSDYQWADSEFPSEEECGEWVEWLQSEVEE